MLLHLALLVISSQCGRFQKMMGTDELRAWYGEAHVLKAADRGAVSTLLISDALFKYVQFLLCTLKLSSAGCADRAISRGAENSSN